MSNSPNPLHYPSLELCKKLTEIGFPDVWRCIWSTGNIYDTPYKCNPERGDLRFYVCPSVMDMIDIIPKHIENTNEEDDDNFWSNNHLRIKWEEDAFLVYYTPTNSYNEYLELTLWSLPDALAKKIIELHKEWIINFNKYE